MRQYSIELRPRKKLKDIGFYHLREHIKKQLLDTGLDSLKTASEKVVHKAGEYFRK